MYACHAQGTSNYVWPLLEMLIEFVQLSIFNGYFLPPGTYTQHTQSDLTYGALHTYGAQAFHSSHRQRSGLSCPLIITESR